MPAGWRCRGTAAPRAIRSTRGMAWSAMSTAIPYPDLIVVETSQEHGVIAVRPGVDAKLPQLPIGARVRILPNHACATGSQHDHYNVVRSGSRDVVATWPRVKGLVMTMDPRITDDRSGRRRAARRPLQPCQALRRAGVHVGPTGREAGRIAHRRPTLRGAGAPGARQHVGGTARGGSASRRISSR